MKSRYILPAFLIGTIAVVNFVQPHVIAQDAVEINNKYAKPVTVKIDGNYPGSGVIVNRQGNTYTILTNWHLVRHGGRNVITTSDNQTHEVTNIRQIRNLDLAIAQFTSNKTYQVAEIANQPLTEGVIAAAPNQNINPMYERLEQFLAQQDFRKADDQTWELMIQAGNGGNQDDLNLDDQLNFSCDALRKIDDLWVKYSQGKFGFSVQKDIWEKGGGGDNRYDRDRMDKIREIFFRRVGWIGQKPRDHLLYHGNLNFSLEAKKGHLPSVLMYFEPEFFSRVANCGI